MNRQLTLLQHSYHPHDVFLADAGGCAPVYVDTSEPEVVRFAVRALTEDLASVTGQTPGAVRHDTPAGKSAVVVATLGNNRWIDRLAEEGRLDLSGLHGAWERFRIVSVANPTPELATALVIVGSDRRGTAFGVFSLSEAAGVSPWTWWADVPPKSSAALFAAKGLCFEDAPVVKYRGIFMNDEDWGLQPWAAKTFEPETGDIGPKTYAKVCELLLRLKANYLWPAMHDCTRAFNLNPENKRVADRFGIVMGSSHCEPMLRNNVSEWPADRAGDWNPVTNLPEILEYWEQRVRENAGFENTWTVGMRGIHDGGMSGGGDMKEVRGRLERIISHQREMLARHVNPNPAEVPQIFCPYKEVLNIYRSGMSLPEDVTLIWPNDSFGYIRQCPNETERLRPGGHGVYYHLSYWGRPHDYLWLESNAPALIWHEMRKAYERGVKTLWVVNVGDIKPTEAGLTFFLKLAWNPDGYGPDAQTVFLREFYAQQFGEEHAEAVSALKDEYFRLCAIRKPEHMGFNRESLPVLNSPWSHAPACNEAAAWLDRWSALAEQTRMYGETLPDILRDAWFQLLQYPAEAAAAMCGKIIYAERSRISGKWQWRGRTMAALRRIEELTEQYNEQRGGKWRRMMDCRPRRLAVFDMPPTSREGALEPPPDPKLVPDRPILEMDPAKPHRFISPGEKSWAAVEGLGPNGRALAVLPFKGGRCLEHAEEILRDAPRAEYKVEKGFAGNVRLRVEALPTHPLSGQKHMRVAASVNEAAPVLIELAHGSDEESDPVWQRDVLRGCMEGEIDLILPNGPFTFHLWSVDPDVVVQGLKFFKQSEG